MLTNRSAIAGCLTYLAASGACTSVTGTWRTVRTEPPSIAFPLHELTLTESGAYRATSHIEGETLRSTGAYRWNGRTLMVHRPGYEGRSYRVARRGDGTLAFTYEINGRKVTAIMEHVEVPSDVASELERGGTPAQEDHVRNPSRRLQPARPPPPQAP